MGSEDEKIVIQLLNVFSKFAVSQEVLLVSALLYEFYKGAKMQRIPEDGDIIVGATAFLNDAFVLTANRRDFPHPFFREVEVTPIVYKERPDFTKSHLVYLVEPNQKLILEKIGTRLTVRRS